MAQNTRLQVDPCSSAFVRVSPRANNRLFPLVGTVSSLLVLTLVSGAAVAQSENSSRNSDLIEILRAEDRRPTDVQGIEPILIRLDTNDSTLQRFAVRALGRLERPELVRYIAPLLAAKWATVRAAAANALAQAVFRGQAERAHAPLAGRLAVETDPAVRGALVQALGRLPYESPQVIREVERLLVDVSVPNAARDIDAVPSSTLLGVARGLESLLRRNRSSHAPSDRTVARLHELARFEGSARVRRLSISALTSSRRISSEAVQTAERDRDAQVQRLNMVALRMVNDLDGSPRILARAVETGIASVRYEALQTFASVRTSPICVPIIRATADADPQVALLAIDLLGGCGDDPNTLETLSAVMAELSDAHTTSWHAPAHALVALATVSPADAASQLDAFARTGVWQVRMYAGRAATELRSTSVLRQLANDQHHNVREAAIRGLVQVGGHQHDSTYVAALEADDYQLLLTAARALEGSLRGSTAVSSLLKVLKRITGQRRETSRDTRVALLDRIGEFGSSANIADLESLVRDFDPVIAAQVAEILTKWTGTAHAADAQPLSPTLFPTLQELRALESATAIIEMRGGGRIELRLLPFDAPTNAARFARLVRAGYFDGLTFHRVVPNFVLQGGSPGANEYAGDGPYTRDELTTRSHLRGTVGLSTRGRDTGDAQIFIHLIDNVRLDHNYTIFAEVVNGMDVVDRLLEGAVIERVRILR